MLSIADIPLKSVDFRGIICALIIGDQEFKFTTYNNTKLIQYDVTITLTLKKNNAIIFSDTSLNCGLDIVQK